MADNNKHLFYLNELSDYKVESGDPDVRGWDVKDSDNRIVGKVDNLLVSKQKEKVVYLDVQVDQSIIEANHKPYSTSAKEGVHEFINKDGENHLIVPIGHVRLNEDDNYVYTDKITHQTFAETKRREKGANIDRDYELVVLESYNRDTKNVPDNAGTKRDAETLDTRRDDAVTRRDASTETLDTGRDDRERRANERALQDDRGTTEVNNTDRTKRTDDDSFYDQKDFDRHLYRQRK